MGFYVIDPRFERLMKSQVSVTHILKPTYRQNPVELTPQLVDLQTMQNCVKNLKNNKAAGHDGICSEHFKYAGLDLLVHVSFVQYYALSFFCTVRFLLWYDCASA